MVLRIVLQTEAVGSGLFQELDYKTCAEMTSAELIVTIGFPPKSIDRSNPDCPVIDLQDSCSITEDMFLDKWNDSVRVCSESCASFKNH